MSKLSPIQRRLQKGRADLLMKKARRSKKNVHIVCRVSYCTQRKRKRLGDQERWLRERCRILGYAVTGVTKRTVSGFDPFWLLKSVQKARKSGSSLFAVSPNRFIRNRSFHSQECPKAQARETDLQALKDITQEVEILTDCDPKASFREERAHETRIGLKMRRKGGRPRKTNEIVNRVKKMRSQGASFGIIAETLKISKATAQRIGCQVEIETQTYRERRGRPRRNSMRNTLSQKRDQFD